MFATDSKIDFVEIQMAFGCAKHKTKTVCFYIFAV